MKTGRPRKEDWPECLVPGCVKTTKRGAKGFCSSHYHQHLQGLIDDLGEDTGKRTRRHKKGEPCLVCGAPAVGRGLCSRHYQREMYGKRTGDPNVETVCRVCGEQHHARGFCQKHYAQWQKGVIDENGAGLRSLKRVSRVDPGAVCRQEGCNREVRTRGWCNKHYLQFRAGILDEDGDKVRDLAPWCRPRKTDRWIGQNGYVLIKAPKGHPRARVDGSILEHRLVMEEAVGRYLEPHEIVHHKDGNPSNNHPDNLQLLDGRKGTSTRHPPGHEVDMLHAAQVLLQQEDLPKSTKKAIERYAKKKK